MNDKLVMGIDFGTDSVRSVIVNAVTGEIRGQAVCPYTRWKEGLFCNPEQNRFRQHPLDYMEGLEITVREALNEAGPGTGENILGISVDTTGSTPCAVDREGIPLALKEPFKNDPDAMFILWKDHTAIEEAEAINTHARTWGGIDYTRYSGEIYSPEWFWAKILHTLRHNSKVRAAAWSWVEHSDWIPYLLTEGELSSMVRSRCTAGHKAMWHESWGGLPSEEFLVSLDPLLSGLRERLYTNTVPADVAAGKISAHWAKRLGINREAMVGSGALDAHIGAVGGGITPGTMVKVMGTSTCDMIISEKGADPDKIIQGISGQVDGSIIPGYTGYEAGQSAFGDVYAWYAGILSWGMEKGNSKTPGGILQQLDREAALIPPDSTVIALDWFNGRRTPDSNPHVKAMLTGLTLGTSAPKIYRALVESTAFGSKAIMDRFTKEKISIDTILAVGGVAEKSPFVMQIMADVLNKPIRIANSKQPVAIGAAMFASVIAGLHKNIQAAQQAMAPGTSAEYKPDSERAALYYQMYKKYQQLGNFSETL